MKIRKPAVAGMFYPADADELRQDVESMLGQADADLPVPKAIIAPHAGYIYSGEIAASAYACLSKAKDKIKHVVLLGPAHRYPFMGLAVPGADFFTTPLGEIAIDFEAINKILELDQVKTIPQAHAEEHSLEVQLPFLQVVLGDFKLLPLVVGNSNADEVAEVLLKLWNGPETLIVISSDLSHFYDYETARKLDQNAAQAIVELDFDNLSHDAACGCTPVQGLLKAAKQKGLKAKLVDLRNSGDTAGTKDSVVGYGAFHVE